MKENEGAQPKKAWCARTKSGWRLLQYNPHIWVYLDNKYTRGRPRQTKKLLSEAKFILQSIF